MVTDKEGKEKLVKTMLKLIANEHQCAELRKNLKHFGRPNAAKEIAKIAIGLAAK